MNLGTLTSWKPLGHSRPVTGLLYLFYIYYLNGYRVYFLEVKRPECDVDCLSPFSDEVFNE
jgi:hypothetical protein